MGVKDITIGNIPGPSQASKVFYYIYFTIMHKNTVEIVLYP
jgi:hypothetical protein